MDFEKELDHQRWLMNNGILTESSKNNLYAYGSLVHTDVQAVYLTVDPVGRKLNYTIYLPSHILSIRNKINALRGKKSLLAMWILRRLLQKYGAFDFQKVLQDFVRDYCGPTWSVNLLVDNIDNYRDNIDIEEVTNGDAEHNFDPKSDK